MELYRILCAVFLFSLVSAIKRAEDGSTLYEVEVKNEEERDIFSELVDKLNLDVWLPAIPEGSGRVLVLKDQRAAFENEFTAAGIQYEVVVERMEELIELERRKLSKAANITTTSNGNRNIQINKIYTYDEVNDILDNLAKDHDSVDVFSQGTTFGDRPIKYIRISSSKFMDFKKPVVFIQALIQAREWVSLPVALHAINKLVTDIDDRDLINDIDWIILPIANPDGYEYTRTASRLWTKNRRVHDDECVGVNINRNFNIRHSGTGSSNNPCSDNYRGSEPESEMETQAIRDILTLHQGRIKLFLNLQSFGSHVLYGHGNLSLPLNGLILNFLAVQMAALQNSIPNDKDRDYIVGNIGSILGDQPGIAIDFATEQRYVGYSYTINIASYGNGESIDNDNGYLVDADNLEEAAEEVWEAIRYSARFVRDNDFNI
ncbi:carboxypeptidase B-like [Achroia grisella]|uniref:carboxypeptidase B-like n=1 Tax=Achroia grisella TaxID=688607 RepID=UPI0027D23A15|nr:carboxypeptidase B-like [Achroia grisella]